MKVGNCLNRISSSLKSKDKVLIFIVVIVISVFIDSQIGIIADFIPEYLSSIPGILLFVGLIVFMILSAFYIINHVKSIENPFSEYVHAGIDGNTLFIKKTSK